MDMNGYQWISMDMNGEEFEKELKLVRMIGEEEGISDVIG